MVNLLSCCHWQSYYNTPDLQRNTHISQKHYLYKFVCHFSLYLSISWNIGLIRLWFKTEKCPVLSSMRWTNRISICMGLCHVKDSASDIHFILIGIGCELDCSREIQTNKCTQWNLRMYMPYAITKFSDQLQCNFKRMQANAQATIQSIIL